MLQKINYWVKVMCVGVFLGVGLQFAQAWTNPASLAPGGNVSGPLTTGAVNQIKNGDLGIVGNLIVSSISQVGKIQLVDVVNENSTCTLNGLIAKNTGGEILSCQSSVWKKAITSVAPAGTFAGQCMDASEQSAPVFAPAYRSRYQEWVNPLNGSSIATNCRCPNGYALFTAQQGVPDGSGAGGFGSATPAIFYCMKT